MVELEQGADGTLTPKDMEVRCSLPMSTCRP
jgi:hypothetical protein